MTLLFFSWWKCKKTAPAFVLLLLLFCRCIFYIIFPFKKYRQGYHERVRVPTTHAYKKHATPDCYSQMRWHQHVMMCGAKNELFCFSWKLMTTCWEIRISALPNFSVKTSLSTCTNIISSLNSLDHHPWWPLRLCFGEQNESSIDTPLFCSAANRLLFSHQ